MMTTSASSFALATLSLAWEGIKRCVTNVGASGLTNKKNTNYFNSTSSFSGSRTRSSSTDFVCVHTRISSTYSRTVVRPMAVPYSQSRTWCSPWPYRILKTSSRTSLRMNARACTPRAEFSDPEKYGAALAKVPKLEISRSSIHTETTYYVTPPLPLHQPDLIPVPDTYQTGPVAE